MNDFSYYHNLMIKAYNNTAFDQSLKIAGYDPKNQSNLKIAYRKRNYFIIIKLLKNMKYKEKYDIFVMPHRFIKIIKLVLIEIKINTSKNNFISFLNYYYKTIYNYNEYRNHYSDTIKCLTDIYLKENFITNGDNIKNKIDQFIFNEQFNC